MSDYWPKLKRDYEAAKTEFYVRSPQPEYDAALDTAVLALMVSLGSEIIMHDYPESLTVSDIRRMAETYLKGEELEKPT